ncbi:thioesterase [Streptomyces sp. V2]|uniref:thioesterase II family protein n=1 Tax=Streptomyces TaxID=1883 RepID=UPI0007C66D64|nr:MULTISPECIES: thioesterase domain-containing protein [Streptomyces]PWG12740.1 thioesterase [Streptomyces sp. V2]
MERAGSTGPPAPSAPPAAPGRWLRCLRPARADAATRLILLPHAGGASGFFRDWPAALPPDVEPWVVQYPGRERRAAEPPPTALSDLAEGAAGELLPLLDRPTAVFGHSMGATVGYELLRLLERSSPDRSERVAHLFVSARQAPHRPRREQVHQLPDDDFAAVVRGHGGTHDEVLANPELRELFLPLLRGDYRMAETHRPTPVAPPLDVDITVLTGDDDPSVDPAEAARWSDASRARFTHHRLPGGHFYLVPRLAEVAGVVVRALRDSAARRCPA